MRTALVLLLVAACGDNTAPSDPTFEGLSGSRIKLQWYLYQDGTRQLEPAAFYDTTLHARCAPRAWSDGVTRCVPLSEDTIYIDADCTMELGRKRLMSNPTHFVGNDFEAGVAKPARLYRAVSETDPPAQSFERHDGQCVQVPNAMDVASYYTLFGPYETDAMLPVHDDVMMMDRLSLKIVADDEGLAAPVGFHDHDLDLDCVPGVLPDGTASCIPATSTLAEYFSDIDCEHPVVVAAEPPRVVTVADKYGCPLYRTVGDEVAAGRLFKRGTQCDIASLATGMHAYHVADPLPLATFDRAIETKPGKRLQRISLATSNLLTFDTRLYDTATRTECKSYGNGELAICVPSNTIDATHLYVDSACTTAVQIAEVPKVTCTPPEFSVTDVPSIHTIAQLYTLPLYEMDIFANCKRHTVPNSSVAHALGPAIPLDTFVGGVVFSER